MIAFTFSSIDADMTTGLPATRLMATSERTACGAGEKPLANATQAAKRTNFIMLVILK